MAKTGYRSIVPVEHTRRLFAQIDTVVFYANIPVTHGGTLGTKPQLQNFEICDAFFGD